MKKTLSIAGSDPSGGAGIQADLKTFAARGTYGMAVITCLTAQNTQGVCGVHGVPADFVARQLQAVLDDVAVDAIKIGMIGESATIEAVADILRRQLIIQPDLQIIVDPVMIAKGGACLLNPQAVTSLTQKLLPLASLITPNLPEAAALLALDCAKSRDEMQYQGQLLLANGCQAVLMKGGHMAGTQSPDLLLTPQQQHWFEGERIVTRNTHGTGCTLSSALAAEIAKGLALPAAVQSAKAYLARAIAKADLLDVGAKTASGLSIGHGPVQHFADYL